MTKEAQSKDDYTALDLARAVELLGERDEQLALLLHRIKQLEKMVYGSRSCKRKEAVDPSLLLPFPNMKDLLADVVARADQRAAEQAAASQSAKKSKTKTPRGRRPLADEIPDDLPRVRKERKLPPEECACGCGGTLKEFREEVARRVDQIKLFFVDERVTTYYSCSKCERVISVAPDQENIVEGSILGPNLLADFVFQRFGNHTPYNRLAKELEQRGFPLSRTVIGRNVRKCGELLEPIFEEIKRHVLSNFLVQIDDTPVVVRNGKEKGRKKGRIWIYRAPDGNVLFDFRMDRSQKGPRDVVGNFRGFIQGDAYSGHDFLFRHNSDRVELGCWSHAIRKFRDARDTNKKLAAEFDVLFALLHQVEIEAAEMTPFDRFWYRIRHARPVLKELEDWLDARSVVVAPKSPMGQAIGYARRQWEPLCNYLSDGRITDITNNAAERGLRRVAIGRKNWMHIGIEDAGKPAAVLMSILQTCSEQGVNAVDYLRDVLVRVSTPGSSKEIGDLTPAGWKRSQDAQKRVAETRASIQATVERLVHKGPPSEAAAAANA
jgi:transposase